MLNKVIGSFDSLKQKIIKITVFDRRIRKTVYQINKYLNKDISKLHLFFEGHVCGIEKEVYTKAVEMCIYFRCITSDDPELRLKALERLQTEALYHESLEMAMNTHRVQMVLIKEIVKAKGDHDLQCRLVSMFYQAQSGRAAVIRRLLNDLGVIEVPEPDPYKESRFDFKKYYTAWDDQVYDNLSSGRKTPSQLLYEFRSKGGSKTTIVYDNYRDKSVIKEALTAAKLLDIDLTLGIECLVQDDRHPDSLPYYVVIMFDNCNSVDDFDLLLENSNVQILHKMLQSALEHRSQNYYNLIKTFNEKSLPTINQGFTDPNLMLKPLLIEELESYAKGRQLHYVHLGRFLKEQITNPKHNIQEARRKYLAQNPELLSQVSETFDNINAEYLRQKYLTLNTCSIDKDSCLSFSELSQFLDKIFIKGSEKQPLSAKLVLTRPLRNGLKPALEFILENYKALDAMEIWNNQAFEQSGDNYKKNTMFLNQFREYLNNGNSNEIKKMLIENKINISEKKLIEVLDYFAKYPLLARINSCADNQNPKAVGKGFTLINSIKNSRQVLKKNGTSVLPFYISNEAELHNHLGIKNVQNAPRGGNILPSGRTTSGSRYDDSQHTYWDDLNHDIKDIYRVAAAFLAVYAISLVFPLFSYGPAILAVWFFITYGRNFVVDMLAKAFAWIHFDRHNAADSVVYSYISVPLLRIFDYLLMQYILVGNDKDLNEIIRIFSVSIFNGFYIVSHNKYRGFNKKTIIANFFRSIVSFPLALAVTWSLKDAGIETKDYTVFINKISSDTVGGIIEGIPKRYAAVKRTQRVMRELMDKVFARNFRRIDVLDLLRVWYRFPKGKAVARKELLQSDFTMEKIRSMFEFPQHRRSYRRYITEEEKWVRSEKIARSFDKMIKQYSSWIKRVYIMKKIKNMFYLK